MQCLKDVLEILYYIAFIVLTYLIVKYSIKTYKLQSSKTSKLLCKISVLPNSHDKDVFQFYLEIYNFGNEVAKKVIVRVDDETQINIDFIKPNESFYYPLGNVHQMISCNRVYLGNDEYEIENGTLIDVELLTEKEGMNFKLNTDILFASRRNWDLNNDIVRAIDDLTRALEMSRR